MLSHSAIVDRRAPCSDRKVKNTGCAAPTPSRSTGLFWLPSTGVSGCGARSRVGRGWRAPGAKRSRVGSALSFALVLYNPAPRAEGFTPSRAAP
ncbi:hypothetical protein C8R45DRAFT_1093707 [Mycena sanguinolenta]|nr:hypothetical protein C8R45DRAFT_1093707 [Mycena sanguinolenta]